MHHYSTTFLLALFSILFCAATSQAQVSDFNLTPISNLTYSQDLNDIWGYVDDTGVEYALVGTKTGTSIVSLADPANPNEVLFIPGATSIWRDLKTWGDFAYVTCDQGQDGLLIIDLSPLPAGTPTYQFWRPELTFNNDTDTLNKAHNLYIDESGYCYIAGSNISSGETFILDVHTTPGTPIFKSATMAVYAHDAYTRGDTLWTSDINDGTFSVYDVSNKNSPTFLANQTTPRNFAHNAWISDNGQALFTTDEKQNAWIGSYDVSDLGNITEIDRWRTPNPNTIPHNVHTFNNYLVISYYTDGLIVLDASRPDNLIEVGRYDTYSGASGSGFNGAWGAYPYLPSGLVLVSDINTGLHVLNPTYQRAGWLEGLITDQNTGANLFDVNVKILNTFAEDNSKLSGLYKTGMGVSGTYMVEYKKAGYIPQTVQVTLTNGQVTTQNIQLVPATAFTITGQVVDSVNQSMGISNAMVYMKSSLYEYSVTADANGNFSVLIFPDNNYEVIAGKWGYKSKLFTLNALDSSTIPALTYPLPSGYKDEYVLDLGWSEFGTATTGKWERGVPENVSTWQGNILPDEGDLIGDLGDYCLITGNNGNGIHGADDIDSGYTTMMSPPMDLTNYASPLLTFYYFYEKSWPVSTEDSFTVYITNGTDTAIVMNTILPQNQWSTRQEIRIKDFISLSNNMRVYFQANDSDPGTAIEMLIDLFEIVDSNATSIHVLANTNIELNYYPNPFYNTIQVDYEIDQTVVDEIPVQVVNTLGQIIEQTTIQDQTGRLELGQNWDAGIYFIAIGNKSIKVIKTK